MHLFLAAVDETSSKLFFDLAKIFQDSAADRFKLFITVLLGSIAFASALPMGDIGSKRKILKMSISMPSLAVGFVFLSFYIINFFSFSSAIDSAVSAAEQLVAASKEADELRKILPSCQNKFSTVELPKIGYGLGSLMGFIVFLWIANAPRAEKK